MNLDGIRLIIFDADGTLRRCTVPGQPCPNRDGEWELIPGVKERVAEILEDHFPVFAIASNQGGVGLGLMRAEVAQKLLYDLGEAIIPEGRDPFVTYHMCPHAPRAFCPCRKPAPGMLLAAMGRAGATPVETLFVGDMESDHEAAVRAGCHFCWAKDFFGWED